MPRSPDDHRIDFIALGAERLQSTMVVTDQIGGKSLQMTTTMDHLPVLAYAPPCNRWTFDTRGPPSLRWNKQATRWALADETIQRSFLRTIDEAFSARADLFVLPPTLSLHHWYGEVAAMIRSTATKHFGQHTEMTRAGWMTADARTATERRQHVLKQHNNNNPSGVTQGPLVRHQHDAARRQAKNHYHTLQRPFKATGGEDLRTSQAHAHRCLGAPTVSERTKKRT